MDDSKFNELCDSLEGSLDNYKEFDKDSLEKRINKLVKKLEDTRNKIKRPEFVWDPDLGKLRDKCERVIDEIIKYGQYDIENIQYIFESVMRTMYGEKIFEWFDENIE